jgi:hypothetical protein
MAYVPPSTPPPPSYSPPWNASDSSTPSYSSLSRAYPTLSGRTRMCSQRFNHQVHPLLPPRTPSNALRGVHGNSSRRLHGSETVDTPHSRRHSWSVSGAFMSKVSLSKCVDKRSWCDFASVRSLKEKSAGSAGTVIVRRSTLRQSSAGFITSRLHFPKYARTRNSPSTASSTNSGTCHLGSLRSSPLRRRSCRFLFRSISSLSYMFLYILVSTRRSYSTGVRNLYAVHANIIQSLVRQNVQGY